MDITKSERPHISFFGCTNSGKSSLVNAVTNQALSVVSDVKGTTTDAVQKSMEILPLGPVVIIDTAGINDGVNDGGGKLGQLRVEATMRILDKTDIAVLVVDSTVGIQKYDENLIKEFNERKIPYITVFNKCDIKNNVDTPPPLEGGVNNLPKYLQSPPPLEGGVNNLPKYLQSPPPLEGGGRGWGKSATKKFDKITQENAKGLRNNATKQEKKLWQYLNKSQLGYKFRRQQPIGKYIADFFCPSLKLIIELDGGQHNREQNKEYDNKRTESLNQLGYKVLRIWNNDIDNNIEGVIKYIKTELTPPPNPLPQGAGETVLNKCPDQNSNLSKNPQCFGFSSVESQRAGKLLDYKTDTKHDFPQEEEKIYPPLEGGSKSLISGWGTCKVSAKTGEGVNELREKLGHIINENKKEKYIIKDRLKQGDIVVLVIPIDESAPKGRIILPQQNVLRECLDAHAAALCCQVEELSSILNSFTPKYVITDSQAFNQVKEIVPENIILTSFSILMANYKGSLQTLLDGAEAISRLQDGNKVLISEGCTHHRQCNDIGTVKLPKWIEANTGKKIEFEFTQGGEFPADLSKYKLIIHCGGCMLNEAEMKSRIKKAKEQGIPIVNYGMAIAYMNGILDRGTRIFNEQK